MPDRPVSTFSRRLAAALSGYMRERGIRQRSLAEHIDRSTGFVSTHLGGLRAVDSDMIDAVAELAGIDTNDLLEEIARRMSQPPPRGTDGTADRIVKEARAAAHGNRGAAENRPPHRRSRGA